MKQFPHLFYSERDSDTCEWIEALGAYSPIIHLQQTDGSHSCHRLFTGKWNRDGIVRGDRLLKALMRSCVHERDDEMFPPCSDIYLTIEVFTGTTDLPRDILHDLGETVGYWRRYVPEIIILSSHNLLDPFTENIDCWYSSLGFYFPFFDYHGRGLKDSVFFHFFFAGADHGFQFRAKFLESSFQVVFQFAAFLPVFAEYQYPSPSGSDTVLEFFVDPFLNGSDQFVFRRDL